MADNVDITAGSGTTILADELVHATYGTGKAQAVKLLLGSAGTGVDAVGGTGVDATGVMRVSLATNVGLPAGTAALGKVKITTDAGTVVDPVAAGSAAMTGSVPVTIATDDTIKAPLAGIAHDSADSGNPIKVGAKAISAEITAVTANDRSNLHTDLAGKLLVLPYANPENFVSGAITSAMTGTTSTSLIAAPAAGLRNYITQITVSNAHATVGTDIAIQDGSGGTTLYTIPAAAVYGGAVVTFPTPLRQPTTATAIFCANVTTGASTKVSASGYKGV